MGLLNLLKASLWGTDVATVTEVDFEEMKIHAIAALPTDVLSQANLDTELQYEWKNNILQQIAYNTNYIYQQERLPISVPYVVLKGTSAAKYYPHPEYRTMGDIDIMTRREDYETACRCLLENGFTEHENRIEEDFGRHRGFARNGIEVEVHAFFALLNDPRKAEYLDDTIIKNINPSHMLPDLVNGLVLLEHFAQHMEEGIGLRQVVDWMMFVDKCLPDEKWNEFRKMAHSIGLEKLAIIATRMCEIFLDLPAHTWCKNADEMVCRKLMDYILVSGNFGRKYKSKNGPGASVLTYARTPFALFRLLQDRGLVNWKAAQNNTFLRPFAWLYQLGRYMNKGLGRKKAILELKEEYETARNRVSLFDALGVKQTSKGLAVYRDGRYVKTYMRP